MKVRKLDKNNDWNFGQNLDNYISNENAVLQNVATRIKSFKNDWFLDSEANIDWLNILASKENEKTIINEVERVAVTTEGVLRINSIELEKLSQRGCRIQINLDTIYSENNILGVSV